MLYPLRVVCVVTTVAAAVYGAGCPAVRGDEPLDFDHRLAAGDLTQAEADLTATLQANPQDNLARFRLGVVQFLGAVEGLAQTQYKYGLLHERLRALPLFRLPVPLNENPQEVGYQDVRAMIGQFQAGLQQAEKTLAQVDTREVKLPLPLGRIRLDLDGDGTASDGETFWRIFAVFNRRVDRASGEAFVIGFDGGDVHWLRGYCHLLMAMCDVALAHDGQELFERCGQLIYPRTKTPFEFLRDERQNTPGHPLNFRSIADAVALVHLINLPVAEPKRMQSALAHLQATIAQSRASWERINAESDDDHEWIPNPKQTGVLPGVRIEQEMVDGWHDFLDEAEALLAGKRLAPFWRGNPKPADEADGQGRGVNLYRVFAEPRRFDLVLWISGTGAAPYLEQGDVSQPATWGRLMRLFRGEFFGFAIWIN